MRYTTMNASNRDRAERFVASAWWTCAMTLIVATGTAAMLLGYRGALLLAWGQWMPGVAMLFGGAILTGAAYLLCSVRDDLLGR
jgi:hypothetical protein